MDLPPAPHAGTLAALVAAALATPDAEPAWDAAEQLAAKLDTPEQVHSAYLTALAENLPAELASFLGQRAARFHDEWFEDPQSLVPVLDRVLVLNPAADWAFARLVMIHTVAARWDELLALYERVLETTSDAPRRAELLDEAAHIAKDCAAQPDRAIDYMLQLLRLRPTDAQLATTLERLLERRERFADLVELWIQRLPLLPRDGRLGLRARIATTCLDRLARPDRALETCRILLEEDPRDVLGCRLLERIVAHEGASPEVRRNALGLLHGRYAATNRSEDLVRILHQALEVERPEVRPALHREAADHLVKLGRMAEAMQHEAVLLSGAPRDELARENLRTLAERTGAHGVRAQALVAAAEAADDPHLEVDLLVEASEAELAAQAHDAAVVALRRAFDIAQEHVESVALSIARRLSGLLEHQGRKLERLAVLERIAALESEPAERKIVLSTAAALATELSDYGRARAAWESRLALDPADREALDALVELLALADDAEALVLALRRRIAVTDEPAAQRSDRFRIAGLLADRCQRIDEAIATYRELEATSPHADPEAESTVGRDPAVVDALGALLSRAGRWVELADLLEHAALLFDGRADRLTALGDVLRMHLGKPRTAAERYAAALREDHSHLGARAGLMALVEDAPNHELLDLPAEALAESYRASAEWLSILSLVEHRLRAARSVAKRGEILIEAGQLAELHAADAVAALSYFARALPLCPDDLKLEQDLLRLAEKTGEYSRLAEALAQVLDVPARGGAKNDRPLLAPERELRLRLLLGSIHETSLNDYERAFEVYRPAAEAHPQDMDAVVPVLRTAALIGRWDVFARVLLGSMSSIGVLTPELHDAVEGSMAAQPPAGWLAALDAIEAALGQLPAAEADEDTTTSASNELARSSLRAIWAAVGLWHRDRRNDDPRAEAALRRAVAADPTHPETLRTAAVLQRRLAGPTLLQTLLLLAEASNDDLGVLYEAAQVALEVDGDKAQAIAVNTRLMRAAKERWHQPQSLPTLTPPADAVPSTPDPVATQRGLSTEQLVGWSLEHLVTLHLESGVRERAIDVLLEGSQLPFTSDVQRELRHRAAELAAAMAQTDAQFLPAAIELYRKLLADGPEDLRAITHLSALYAAGGDLPALAQLRRHELDLTSEPPRRLQIRRELARVLGELDDDVGQIDALLANLEEVPGHDETLADLTTVLVSRDRWSELARILTEQALRLEVVPEPSRAAALWRKVADISATHLTDTPRALESLRRVVALSPTLDAYDLLADLHLSEGQTSEAITWLERRLYATAVEDRGPTWLRLASALVAHGQHEQAREVLVQALAEHPQGATAVRLRLAEFLRDDGAFHRLVAVLRDGSEQESDPRLRFALLREAAEVELAQLDRPAAAVPLLREAIALAGPDQERPTRLALADALRRSGELDEARELLLQLVDWYGRRRPPERAQAHVLLARIAHARSLLSEALAQLEMASSMDLANVEILHLLGSLAQEAGEYVRAERAYRTLLLALRKPMSSRSEYPSLIPPSRPSRRTDTSARVRTGGETTGGEPTSSRPGGEQPRIYPSEVLFELHRIAKALDQPERAQENLESAFEAALQSEAESRRFTEVVRRSGDPNFLVRALRTRVQAESSPDAAAQTLGELAEVLDALDRPEEALSARLEALSRVPLGLTQHAAARRAAVLASRPQAYLERLRAMTAERELDGDLDGTVFLLLRRVEGLALCDDMEGRTDSVADGADVARKSYSREAVEVLEHAEALGARSFDVLRALATAYADEGNDMGRARVLRRLMYEGDEVSRAESRYQLSALLVRTSDAVDEGLDALADAFDATRDASRALEILTTIRLDPSRHDTLARAAALQERIARTTGEPTALLDALDRVAATANPALSVLEEGAELAISRGERERAARFAERAVQVAEADEALPSALWAIVLCAEHQLARGDVASAAANFERAGSIADAYDGLEYGLRAASLTLDRLGDLDLAARRYAAVLARFPGERKAWDPLLSIHRQRGDRRALEELLGRALEEVADPQERNLLRLERVRILLQDNRDDAAAETLHAILEEDPHQREAASSLATIYRRQERRDDLISLFSAQMDWARDKHDAQWLCENALGLAEILAIDKREEALSVLRQALELAPDQPDLLRARVALHREGDDPFDFADALERLLPATTGQEAVLLARDLADLRAAAFDVDGEVRALQLGYRASLDAGLSDRLTALLVQRNDFRALVDHLELEASTKMGRDAVDRLREAARLSLLTLSSAQRAVELLQRARTWGELDTPTVLLYVDALAAAGRMPEAFEELEHRLERPIDKARQLADGERGALYRVRAKLHRALGEHAGEVLSLELAWSSNLPEARDELIDALGRQRKALAGQDPDGERRATLRLVEIVESSGDYERARSLLEEQLQRSPRDLSTTRALVRIERAAGTPDREIAALRRLLPLEEERQRGFVAVALCEVLLRHGQLNPANDAVRAALASDLRHAELRHRLRNVLESIDALGDLARLTVIEADLAATPDQKFERLMAAAALFLRASGEEDQAVAPLRSALTIKPTHHDAIIQLADVYIGMLEVDHALSVLGPALERHRGRRNREISMVQHRMARAAAAAGSRPDELAWLARALDSDMQNGQVAAELAEVALEMGQFELALKALKAVTLLRTPGPMSRALATLRQGQIAYRQGDAKRALLLARKALADDPHLTEAEEFLREVGG